MALLGKLLISIDADLTGLRNQIKAAERVMRDSSKTLGGLASSLSQSISLPLAAIGVGAIKSAADMERLNSALSSTMEAAGRSSEAATKELEALRQAALAPGLDFEQAVKGSVRLQNVGFSAEKARNILVQLANAVAITGGQAQELDGVTRQFGQMIAKGRILQEDLSIIQENMPAVAVAMEKAFGTKSAEQLRNMGVSAEQFVDGVTKALSELPRVSGGLANSIVNAFSAVKLAAAQVGEVLNKQFGISERLNEFAAFLGELSKGFQALDSSTQSAILGVAAFALALGPAIKIGSLVVSSIGGISVAAATMRQAFAAVQTGGLIAWFQGLNSVMKANIFGVVVGVALAAAAAFALLSKETSAATKTQETLSAIQKQAADSVAAERVKIGLLVDTLKSETATRDEKRAALAKLNEIAPTYFKGLDAEKISVDALNIAYDKYIESLLRAARAKAAEEKLIELDKQALDLAERRNAAAQAAANFKVPDRPQGFRNDSGDLQDSGARAASLAIQAKANSDIQIKALDDQAAAVKFQMDALKGLIKANGELVPSEGNKAKAIQASIAATKEANKAAGVYREALADIQKEIDKAALTGADAFEAQAEAIEAAIGKVLDAGFGKGSKEVQGLIDKMKALKASVETIGPLDPLAQLSPDAPVSQTAGVAPASPIQPVPVEVLDSYARLPEYLQAWQDKVTEAQLTMDTFWAENGAAMQLASEAMVEFGSTIENSLADANTSWADFGQAAKQAIVGVIANLIKLAVANAVTKSFASSPNPLLGAALAAIAGGLAAGLFKRLVGSAKFATGTLSAPGGRALVGEEGPELLNLPSSSGVRIPAQQTAAVLGALDRAAGQVRNVQQAAQNGLTVVGQNGPEYVNLPAGAQVIPAPQTREVLQSLNRSVTDSRRSTTTDTVRSTINRDIAERIRRGLAAPAYAVGTLGAKGGRSLVGERGPELVNLPNLSGVKLPALQAAKVMEAVSRQFSESRTNKAYSTVSDTVRNSLSNSAANTSARSVSEAVRNLVTNSQVSRSTSDISNTVRNSVANSRVSRATSTLSEAVRNSQIFNRFNIPQFAAGTLYAPGGLSLVGEFGPELVNLARGAQVLPSLQTEQVINTLQSGGGTQQVQVGGTFRIVGTDLVVVLEGATRKANRVR